MNNLLYCIRHEKTFKAYHGVATGLFHLLTIHINNSPDPGTSYDVEECDFSDGWATVPPPEFDMEQFLDDFSKYNEPPFMMDEWYGDYVYDINTDTIVREERAS